MLEYLDRKRTIDPESPKGQTLILRESQITAVSRRIFWRNLESSRSKEVNPEKVG
jgi:hypothetical protein